MRSAFTGNLIRTFLLIILCSGSLFSDTKIASESDLKKQAERSFNSEDYEAALPSYSRLLSLYPKEASYNYRFGVCLLLAGKEKSNAANFLEIASKDINTPEEVWYFLGKSYMINNDFSKAKDALVKFKSTANISKQKKYDVDAAMQNCESGNQLLKSRKNIVISSSKEVARNAFYSSFDFSNAPGKIVNAAAEFLTPIDKQKEKDPVMYIGNDRQTVYLSSYGKKGETGKDIYVIRKTPTGQWSLPENIGTSVNTNTDEDFPFLARDGRTLYFSSKGHNSIGGYDIFKSVYDFNTGKWSEPENLGIPINTIGDDLLYLTDDKGQNAVYATNAESVKNFISIRKIQLPANDDGMLTISGVYIPVDQKVRRDARISVLTSSGDGIITSVHTDPNSGKYELVLSPGQSYMIVVEGGGYLPHAEVFELPAGMINPELRQVVKVNKDSQKEELTLQNFFASGKAPDQPTASVTHAYPTSVDSSAMMGIKINNQVVFVNQPDSKSKSSKGKELASSEGIDSENDSDAVSNSKYLPTVKIKRRDKYDPTLSDGLSPAEKYQEEEEAERTKEIDEESKQPDKVLAADVSNEELAKMAYNDAQAIQDEADNLKTEVDELRFAATEKQNTSVAQKSQAEKPGLSADSVTLLLTQSELNKSEAEELYRKADEMSKLALSKESESKAAVAEANEIFNISKTPTVAANNKKPTSNSKIISQADLKSKEAVVSVHSSDEEKETASAKTSESKNEINESKKVEPTVSVNTSVKEGKSPNANPEVTKIESSQSQKTEPVVAGAGNSEKPVEVKSVDAGIVPVKASTVAVVSENKIEGKANSNPVKTETEKTVVKPVDENLFVKDESVATEITPSSESEYIRQTSIANMDEGSMTIETNNCCEDMTPPKPLEPAESVSDNLDVPKSENNVSENLNTATESNQAINKQKADSNVIVENEKDKTSIPAVASENKSVDNNKSTEDPLITENTTDTKSSTQKEIVDANKETGKQHFKIDGIEKSNTSTTNENVSHEEVKAKEAESSKANSDIVVVDKNQKEADFRISEKTGEEVSLQPTPKVSDQHSIESAVKSQPIHTEEVNATKDETKGANEVAKSSEAKTETTKNQSIAAVSKTESKSEPKSEKKVSQSTSTISEPHPVKEEAKIKYRESQTKLDHSNELTKQSLAIQNELSQMKSSPKRDELIRQSNELTLQSIHEWQDALILEKEAEKIDPGVAYKMQANDVALQNNTADQEAIATAANESSNSNAETNFGTPIEERSVSDLDTTHVDYPVYVKIQKEIKGKQVETIDVFAEGINISKKALEEKEEEMALRDQAHVEKNEKKRNALLKQADEKKLQSEKDTQLSKDKFTIAQAHTSEVKGLRSDLVSVREKIVKKSDQENAIASSDLKPQTNKPVVVPEKKSTVSDVQNVNRKKNNASPSQPIAMAENEPTDLNVTEAEISSVSFMKDEVEDFSRNKFSVNPASPYSAKNPIPMNPPLPDGLVFKVQVGAFHKPLPADIFKGLQPISGETTRPGWIRYCVGLFNTFEPANIVKKEVQKSGYKDAFVVAYYNGKRIGLNEAYAMIKGKENLTAYKGESSKEVAMLRAINIKDETSEIISADKDERLFYGKPPLPVTAVTDEAVEYAVQVGVYRTAKAPAVLASLQPLEFEEMRTSLYRFTYGRYQDRTAAEVAKQNAVKAGVADAFIIVYKNRNPAVVSSTGKIAADNSLQSSANDKAPVNPGKPEITNPVTVTDTVYKVQIGAFKNNIPYNAIETFLAVSDKGIEQLVDDRNLHIFYVGNCSTFTEATNLRTEIVGKGIKDAFVVAISNGKRIVISEGMKP